jgi:hypothetical protein
MYGIIIKKLEVKNIRKINERLEIERKILEDLISDIDINNDKFSINDLILYQSMKVDKLIIIYEKLNNKCFKLCISKKKVLYKAKLDMKKSY